MEAFLREHFGYLSARRRLEVFDKAINHTVLPRQSVLDLGCGTGVLGLLCLQAGAGHVYAVDSSSALEVAREALSQSWWADRVEFIRGSSFQVELPHKVDLVICDHVGYFGFDYGLIALLADARHRFLKPGGKLVPRRLQLQVAPVESGPCHELVQAWTAPCVPSEFHWLRQHSINTKHPVKLKAEELLSSPAELADIDLAAENPEFFSWAVQLKVARDGIVHGIGGWFACELAEGVWMTNSPASEDAIERSQVFLPIDGALPVKEGDVLDLTIMARPADNLIVWKVHHPASGRRFSQSTWHGDLLGQEHLARSDPEHVPRVSRTAEARTIVLGYCDGSRSVAEVKEAVLKQHPHLFPTHEEIARFVTGVLSRDTH